MRAANILVYDEYMTSDTSGAVTSDAWHATLGAFDQIAMMVVVDDITDGSTGFKVKIMHSADGRNWLPRNGDLSNAEIGDMMGHVLPTPDGRAVYAYGDLGIVPCLGLIRISVDLGSTGAARIRVYVTGRNLGKS